MKRDWNAMAQGILDAVGGPENISGMTHCATRLRLNLKDDAACDDAAVKEVEGVVNTLNKAGQYQVLIGTEVPKLYEKFEPLVKGSGVEISAATKDEGESIVSQIFSAISGIFAPQKKRKKRFHEREKFSGVLKETRREGTLSPRRSMY